MTLEEIIQSILQPQPGVSAGGPGEIVRSRLADPSQMPRADSGRVMQAGFGSMAPARPPQAIARPEPNAGDLGRIVPDTPNAGVPYSQPAQPAAPAAKDAPALDLPSTSGIGAFLRGLGKGDGALLPAIGEGIGAVEGRDRNRLAQNQTYQWLINKGSPAEEAAAAIGNPDMLQNLVKKYTNPALTDDQREYAAAQAQGYKGSLVDFIKEGRRTNALRWVNTGTMMEGRDPITGEVITSTPIDVAGAAEAKSRGGATGKFRGQAQAELPGVIQTASEAKGILTSLRDDEYLPNMLGPIGGHTPDILPAAQRVRGKIDQISGQAFLTAFEKLKGGGQITETEGKKATEAISRLSKRGVGVEDYKAAIADLMNIIDNGVLRARIDAGELGPEALSQLKPVGGTSNSTEAATDTVALPGTPAATGGGLPRVNSPADAAKLPSGTRFVDPNGVERVVP
jgi:hypothetical protein